ncbi:hypothetical protein [Methylococcus geothermalis]|uniref:Uncharacterized protein n=1 Tax=Methylococcus geothermalis TaxID=2681310 RepID=A0A858Q4F9_9GAMM|nr:hypothetical protein [Methylococcus geothermalis]QJD28722.1 hypothetical protein GNH96_01205 [Methylococcus geothermalis]
MSEDTHGMREITMSLSVRLDIGLWFYSGFLLGAIVAGLRFARVFSPAAAAAYNKNPEEP